MVFSQEYQRTWGKIFEVVEVINNEKGNILKNTYSAFRERLTKILTTKGNLRN